MKEIKLIDIIKESKGYFIVDIMIWLFAHNIPILLAYLLKLYFDANFKDSLYIIVILYIVFFGLRTLLIKLGADADIKAQHKRADSLYQRIITTANEKVALTDSQVHDLVDIIQNDVNSIVGTISYGIDTFCNLLGIIIAFIIMMSINIYITILVMLLPLLIFFISNSLKDKIYDRSNEIRDNESKIIESFQKIIEDARPIRIESLEDTIYKRHGYLLAKNKDDKIKYGQFKDLISVANDMVVDLNIIIILLGSIIAKLSPGDVSLFISYSFSINDLATYISSFTIIYRELGVNIDSFNKKISSIKIEAEDFIACDWLKDKLKENTINVLIGKNGSGKTRILKALSKSYRYPLIFKNSSIINENLYENISLGDDVYNYDDLLNIFSLEDLDNRDILSDKELSGGQIDRIAILRSLRKNVGFLLIDKNLSSIDRAVRMNIIKYLENLNMGILLVDQEERDEYSSYNKIYIDKVIAN